MSKESSPFPSELASNRRRELTLFYQPEEPYCYRINPDQSQTHCLKRQLLRHQHLPNHSLPQPSQCNNPSRRARKLPPSPENERTRHPPVTHNLLVIGQYDDLYIFCKTSEGLLVIDQHAAHERLLYEKLRKQYLANTIVRQTLMFPETVELSLFQAQLVEKNEEEIDRIGFSIREFGGNTYIISAVPALAGLANPRELFLDILEQFGSENNKGEAGGFLDTILANNGLQSCS